MRWFLMIVMFVPLFSFAQDPEPTEAAALFKVFTRRMDKTIIRPQEEIAFINRATKKEITITTDEEGAAKVLLPKDAIYDVYNRFLNSTKPVSKIEVPADPGLYTYKVILQWDMSGSSFRLKNIEFDTGKSALRSSSFEQLDNLVAYLQKYDQMTIEIQGHTDDVGTEESNQKLSQSRANTVLNYLVKNGIAASRLEANGYGESKPIADNSTKEGKQKNRRTTVKIITE